MNMVFSLCIILMLRLYVPGMLCWRQRRRPPLTIMTTTISITITILSLTLHTASSQDIFSGSNFLGKNVPCVKTIFSTSDIIVLLQIYGLARDLHKCKHCTDKCVLRGKERTLQGREKMWYLTPKGGAAASLKDKVH